MPEATPTVAGFSSLELIGEGMSSTVWAATQDDLGREVALKILRPGFDTGSALTRFEREKQISARLGNHPYVVGVYSTGITEDGRPYLVMDLCRRGTVAQAIDRDGPFGVSEAVDLIAKVCSAVNAGHERGFLHRDIKPENILLGDYGPALADFGIARGMEDTRMTTTNVHLSVMHAAPESFLDTAPTMQMDIYSLGSTLYTMLSGHPAFVRRPDESYPQFALRLAQDPLPLIERADLPDGVMTAIQTAMAKDPSDRYESANDFAVALTSALEASPPSVPSGDVVTDDTMTFKRPSTSHDEGEPGDLRGGADANEDGQSRHGKVALVVSVAALALIAVVMVALMAMSGGGSSDPTPKRFRYAVSASEIGSDWSTTSEKSIANPEGGLDLFPCPGADVKRGAGYYVESFERTDDEPVTAELRAYRLAGTRDSTDPVGAALLAFNACDGSTTPKGRSLVRTGWTFGDGGLEQFFKASAAGLPTTYYGYLIQRQGNDATILEMTSLDGPLPEDAFDQFVRENPQRLPKTPADSVTVQVLYLPAAAGKADTFANALKSAGFTVPTKTQLASSAGTTPLTITCSANRFSVGLTVAEALEQERLLPRGDLFSSFDDTSRPNGANRDADCYVVVRS